MIIRNKVFTVRAGHEIKHVGWFNGKPSEFDYQDGKSGYEFDIRRLPAAFIGDDRSAVLAGDRAAHRRCLQRALKAGHDFTRRT